VFRKDSGPAPETTDEEIPESVPGGQAGSGSFGRGVCVFVAVAVLAMLVSAFVARLYAIPSGSMETTLHGCAGCSNDRVLVDKVTYRFSTPQSGDIVVFTVPESWHNVELPQAQPPSNPIARALGSIGAAFGMERPGQTDFIKRVIAVGGQTVSCCDTRNRLIVDGRSVDEPFVYFAPEYGKAQQDPFGPVLVPQGQLWVMGDSRNNSVDSRAPDNGPIPVDSVVGKARWIVVPLGRFGPLRIPGSPTDQ